MKKGAEVLASMTYTRDKVGQVEIDPDRVARAKEAEYEYDTRTG